MGMKTPSAHSNLQTPWSAEVENNRVPKQIWPLRWTVVQKIPAIANKTRQDDDDDDDERNKSDSNQNADNINSFAQSVYCNIYLIEAYYYFDGQVFSAALQSPPRATRCRGRFIVCRASSSSSTSYLN